MVSKFVNNTKYLKTMKFGNRKNIIVYIQFNIPGLFLDIIQVC